MEIHLLQIAAWVIIVGGMMPLALIITLKDGNRRSIVAQTLSVLVVWCGLEILAGLLLGLFGLFKLIPLLALNALVGGAGLYVCLKSGVLKGRVPNLVNQFGKLTGFEAFWVLLITLLGGSFAWKILVNPATELDSISYHLPQMAEWIQSGFFTPLQQYPQVSRYPYNWELLCALNIIPFREDFLAALPNLLAWLIAGLAIYLLCREYVTTRVNAIAAAGVFLILPIIDIDHIIDLHVDLPLAAFFFSALYFLSDYVKRGNWLSLGIATVATGILVGIKTTGGLFLVALAIGIFLFKFDYKRLSPPPQNHSSIDPRSRIVSIGLMLAGNFLAGFWYVKNFVETGNFFGPMSISVGDSMLIPGTRGISEYHASSISQTFDLTNLAQWKVLIDEIDIWLGLPFYFMLIILLFGSWLVLREIIKPRNKSKYGIAIPILACITALIYINTPSSGFFEGNWLGMGFRFGFPLLGLMAILFAGALERLKIHPVLPLLIVSASLFMSIGDSKTIEIALLILTVFVSLGKAISSDKLGKIVSSKLVIAIALILLAWGSIQIRGIREENRTKAYGYIHSFQDKYVPKGTRIGIVQRNRSYVLYGRNLNYPVVYIPADSNSTEEKWIEKLRERDVEVVALNPPESLNDIPELEWLMRPGGNFVKIFGNYGSSQPTLFKRVDKLPFQKPKT